MAFMHILCLGWYCVTWRAIVGTILDLSEVCKWLRSAALVDNHACICVITTQYLHYATLQCYAHHTFKLKLNLLANICIELHPPPTHLCSLNVRGKLVLKSVSAYLDQFELISWWETTSCCSQRYESQLPRVPTPFLSNICSQRQGWPFWSTWWWD